MYIYSHNRYSEGANLIRKALRIKSLARHIESRRPLRQQPLINWGAASIDFSRTVWRANRGFTRTLNTPDSVALAHNKLLTFNTLTNAAVSVPDWTEERATAQQWVNEGYTVVVRTLLNASEGKGIILWNRELPLADNVRAPLYVKYIKKKHEYRVHVAKAYPVNPDTGTHTILCIQQKLRKRGFENRDNQIRNHDNGWVFAVNDIVQPHTDIKIQSIEALKALALDFGAVDVVWNERQQKAYVLEVNTAPGLEPEGTALKAYVDYFRHFMTP